MDALSDKLRTELLKDPDVRCLQSKRWYLPVHTLEITYETVRRTTMDVLMKMLLLTFGKMEIKEIEEVSDILLVEPLFIEGLIKKMKKTGMIVQANDGVYSLTETGEERLRNGVFIDSPEEAKVSAYYSPAHNDFLFGEWEGGPVEERYRYAQDEMDVSSIETGCIMEALEKRKVESLDQELQVDISEIVSVTAVEEQSVNCLEFLLHHTKNDRIYVRVWNTMTAEWDEKLETDIVNREQATWRAGIHHQ